MTAQKVLDRVRADFSQIQYDLHGRESLPSFTADFAHSHQVSENGALSVTFSAGVAVFIPGESEASDLIDRADKALYEAKHQGRNCVVIATQ